MIINIITNLLIVMRKKPPLKFSKWMKWEDRKNFQLRKCPGVYMIAITNKNLEDKKVDCEDVVYIGMTISQTGLKGRWEQFNNSINGKSQHSGGDFIFKKLGHYKKWGEKLFVCTQAFECNTFKNSENPRKPDDLRTMGWIAYLEYEAMAKFKEKMKNKEPKYNRK